MFQFRGNWIQVLFFIQAFQVSYPVLSLDDSVAQFSKDVNVSKPENITGSLWNADQNQTHRVIKRFTPHFRLPPPHIIHLPTLPRPNFQFPLFDRNVKGDDEDYSEESGETTIPPPESSGDRTLLAAKKAILLKKAVVAKKAIILAKLKKKAFKKKKKKKFKKKAIIAGLASYGYSKVKGGVSIKTPNIKLTLGGGKDKDKDKEEEEEEEDDTQDETESNKKTENKKKSQNNTTTQDNVPAPSPQTYTSSKKKKGKKKRKGWIKPRPVNLGVKANLYKKFDKVAKKAKDQLSSYVQIDIDFLNGRSSNKDVIEPARFTSRIAPVSSHSKESNEFDYANDIQVARNNPPWSNPNWKQRISTTKI
ncbi:hypothetical protein Ocin01_02835 [Orchesella cincta]|uniref:Uncharacterized protein n=1 Tax=Orchesella cincta TaxID=48709 RepID=A0A1D2NF66_ORCCI|nr:hypothetical protein Ocin01_02835 [Orchesella cincta]